MNQNKWRQVNNLAATCEICGQSRQLPGWATYDERGALRYVCVVCDRDDLRKRYVNMKIFKHANASATEPSPPPLPGSSRPKTSGQKIFKRVFRDPKTREITGVEESVPATQADKIRDRLADDWRGMTVERLMKVPSYRRSKSRGRR